MTKHRRILSLYFFKVLKFVKLYGIINQIFDLRSFYMKNFVKVLSFLLVLLMSFAPLACYADSGYVLSNTLLSVGKADYDIDQAYEYTVFVFKPEGTGKYTISSDNAKLGIVSYNGMWATVVPSADTVNDSFIEWSCTSVGQKIWIAVDCDSISASVSVEMGEAVSTESILVEYVNKTTPSAFMMDSEKARGLIRVETFDDVVDSAVLGSDGKYHYNDVNGPVLYANLSDSVMSLYGAYGYGQLKYVVYENGKSVSTIDYNSALNEYYTSISGSSKYYPLTDDLIEMFKNVGQGKGWYGADGFVGGDLDDAWMFACYFVHCDDESHVYGEWEITSAPTAESDGEKIRSCTSCGSLESESVPKIQTVPEQFSVSAENYTVTMTAAEKIDAVYYAIGEYASADELINAEDARVIDASQIALNTADGLFTYEMPDGGVYSFAVCFDNGAQAVETLDMTRMTQSVSADGLMMTVSNLYGVKDYFIVKGHYTTYRDFRGKSDMRVSATRINGAKDFTYTVKEPGHYTVCVRYNDAAREHLFLYCDVTVVMPEIKIDGLQVTVTNLENIQVMRSAPGEWSTTGEVKRAPGNRNFTVSTIKGADSYTIQYYESGVYTLTVEYKNGLKVIKTFEVSQKQPAFEQNGNSVTFGELDDMYVLRYVKGEYATIGEVKRADGSKYRKPRDIKAGAITIDGLEDGIYTFCVQYNDLSTTVYSVMVGEPVVDVEAIDISTDRQLMLDDYVIDTENSSFEFVMGVPEKKEASFIFNKSYETSDTVFHNIVTMPDGTYRMYYMATAGRRRICYIESKDGLKWTRPNLTTNLYNGEKYTNIVTNETVNPASLFVYWDTNPAVPYSDKLRGLYGQWGDGLFIEHTTDGNFFEYWPNETMIMGNPTATQGCFFDTLNTIYWDDAKGKYYAFVRGFHDADGNYNLSREFVSGNYNLSLRDIRVSESTDGKNWTIPTPLSYSDGNDYQMYANAIIPYYRAPEVYVGLPTRFTLDGNNKYTDVFFMSSRDLYNWNRSETPFLSPGEGEMYEYPKSGYPCVGYIETTPGEMSFFMEEYDKSRKCDVLYRYSLRVDGFTYAVGDKIVTKPVTFDGDSLELNYNGELRVTVSDMYGRSVTSDWLSGDEYAKQLDLDLSAFKDKPVILTFEMKDAELYSFKFN